MYNKWIFLYVNQSEKYRRLAGMWPADTPMWLITKTVKEYYSHLHPELTIGDWKGFGSLPYYDEQEPLRVEFN